MAINRDNLRFLLSHFDPPVFPRRISTQLSKNKQFAVNSLEEMLRKFEESELLPMMMMPPSLVMGMVMENIALSRLIVQQLQQQA
jgi:hypothetical protein